MDKNKRSRMRKGGMGKESIQKEVDKHRELEKVGKRD